MSTPQHGFEALFRAALDAVFVIDDERTLIEANPAACRLVGAPCDTVLGRRFDDYLEAGTDVDAAWRRFLDAREQSGELRIVRSDGTVRDVEYAAAAHFTPGRHLAILRDITERKHADAERTDLLRREQERLRETETLLAVSRALSSTLDPTETLRRVAREIAHTLGADMVGAYRADPARRNLWAVAGYRVPRAMLDAFRTHPIPIRDHPAIENALARRRVVWTDDMPNYPHVDSETFRKFPHQTDLFVPILVKDQPVAGFFVIWWTARRPISEDELRLLQGIGDLAGIFLEAAQLYQEVADASRAKDEFLATLSHELRNPLGAIANAIVALDQTGSPGELAVRLREIIRRQTQRLAGLVDDLLDVARVTAGKVVLDRQPIDLGDVAAQCVRTLRESGKAQDRRVTLHVASLIVSADANRLEQVVTNLLDNAVKYTPPGGAIDIEVVRDGSAAVLRVTDTGVGIAPEMLPRVFELFTQAATSMDRTGGGLGIGLSVTRRLVEMHDGSITADSDGLGQGARFTVRLPVESGAVIVQAAPTPGTSPARRILIIEDNDDARESLRFVLEALGHEVLEARDGPEGLAVATGADPDVILVDLGLPGLDGYEVARAIRARDARRRTTVIAVTGYGQAEDRRRSKEAGFDAHLVKPVSHGALLSLIAAA